MIQAASHCTHIVY